MHMIASVRGTYDVYTADGREIGTLYPLHGGYAVRAVWRASGRSVWSQQPTLQEALNWCERYEGC